MRAVMGLCAILLASACGDARSNTPTPAPSPSPAAVYTTSTRPHSDVGVAAAEAAAAARAEPLGCAGVFARWPAIVPRDLGASASCAPRPAHQPPQIYDDCQDASWTLTGCDVPFGAQFCHGGHWTIVCKADADCPAAMRCTSEGAVGTLDVAAVGYGACAMRCTSDASCRRCDEYCDREDGVCRPRIADEEEEGPGEEAEEECEREHDEDRERHEDK